LPVWPLTAPPPVDPLEPDPPRRLRRLRRGRSAAPESCSPADSCFSGADWPPPEATSLPPRVRLRLRRGRVSSELRSSEPAESEPPPPLPRRRPRDGRLPLSPSGSADKPGRVRLDSGSLPVASDGMSRSENRCAEVE